MRTTENRIETLLARVALGSALAPLSWQEIATLRVRYWRAGNDTKKRLGCLKAFLRRRARFRLFVAPALVAVISVVAAAVSGEPLAWAAGIATAVAEITVLVARPRLLAWLDRVVPDARRSESVDSADADRVCEDFELHVAALRSRAGESVFRGFTAHPAVTLTRKTAWRVSPDDPIERFDWREITTV